MELLATAEQMREFDRRAIDGLRIPGILLMENAGRGFVDALERETGPVRGKKITVICGKGNNAGDGFVIARHCATRGAAVSVECVAPASSLSGDPAVQYLGLKRLAGPAKPPAARITLSRFTGAGPAPDIIVDALFGTGFVGNIRAPYDKAIGWINRQKAFVASVDIPSGVNGTTGAAAEPAVRAGLTVTMGLVKTGHVAGAGRDLSGKVVVVDLGVPASIFSTPPLPVMRVERGDAAAMLPRRERTAHKYSVGKVFILGGSKAFTGAPALTALAALRSGCGAVILGIPASIQPILARKLTEVILLPLPETRAGTVGPDAFEMIMEKFSWADAVAIGPGLGRDPETDALLLSLLQTERTPIVLDADGLTACAGNVSVLKRRKGETVLTPHTGELSRLLGVSAESIEEDRITAARDAAKAFRSTLVLKGAPTITASAKGRCVVNSTGNPGMATIGSGDVLTGVIVSLLAQGASAEEAAWGGAFVHGAAGDAVAQQFGERSLLAGDLLDALPGVLRSLEGA